MITAKIYIIIFLLTVFFSSDALSQKKNNQNYPSSENISSNTLHDIDAQAEILFNNSEYEKSLQLSINLLKDLDNISNFEIAEKNLKRIIKIHENLNQFDEVITYTKQLLNIYKLNKQQEKICKTLDDLGYYYFIDGAFPQSILFFEQAITCKLSINASDDLLELYNLVGVAYYQINNLEKATDYLNKAIELALKLDDSLVVAQANMNLGNVYADRGNYETAVNHYFNSYQINLAMGNERSMATGLNNIGTIYQKLNRDSIAKDYYQQALKIRLKIEDDKGIASTLMNLGCIFEKSLDLDSAMLYYTNAVNIFTEIDIKTEVAGGLYNIGNILLIKKDFKNAEKYGLEALSVAEELDNNEIISRIYVLLGEIAYENKDYNKSIQLLNKSMEISKRIKFPENIAAASKALFESYYANKDFKDAIDHLKNYYIIKDSLEASDIQKNLLYIQTKYETEVNRKQIEVLKQESQLNEAELKRQTLIRNFFVIGFALLLLLTFLTARLYSNKRKSHKRLQEQNSLIIAKNTEIALQTEKLAENNIQLLNLNKELEKLSIVASETDSAILIIEENGQIEWANKAFEKLYGLTLEDYFKQYGNSIFETSTNKNIKELFSKCISERKGVVYESAFTNPQGNTTYFQTTLTPVKFKNEDNNIEYGNNGKIKLIAIDSDITKIKEAEEEILNQHRQISLQKKEITDSIMYAKRIQMAILPSHTIVNNYLSDSFILFKPRDIVSGDFYWVNKIDNYIVAVAADCTGHGVPGAFMSLLGVTFLNQIVNNDKVLQANEILNRLRTQVINSLHQTGKIGEQKDGMDLSLIILDIEKLELQYAGANNPLYLIKNSELMEFKADKMPIGIYENFNKSFTNNIIKVNKGDSMYLFSDGYVDQFGGPLGKKFMSKRFKKLLNEVNSLTMDEQRNILDENIEKWKSYTDKETNMPHEQVDDIIIMGLRV